MNTSNRMKWVAWVFMALVLFAFLPSVFMKLSFNPMAVEGFRRMGIPDGGLIYIGLVELACLVIFLIPRTTVLGTLLLTGYLGGATMANIINRSDFLHALAVGLLVWAITWIRVPQFRELVPFLSSRNRTSRNIGEAQPELAYHR